MSKIAIGLGMILAIVAVGTRAETTAAALPPEVVVRQSGVDLTLADIDARLMSVPPEHRAGFFHDPERIEQALRSMLLTRMLAAQAVELGIAEDPVVRAQIEAAGLEVLAKHRLRRFANSIPTHDMAPLAREYYLANPEQYTTPDLYEVRHLLVTYAEHGVEGARRRARELRDQFAKEGGDFKAFVQAHSEEKGADEKGGLLTGVKKGDTEPDFEAAFLALKPGEVSEPVKTKWGMHIVQLVSMTPGSKQPFEAVRADIEQTLAKDYRAKEQNGFLSRVRSGRLEANEELVASLRTRYLPAGEGQKAMERVQQPAPGEYERFATGTGTMDGND